MRQPTAFAIDQLPGPVARLIGVAFHAVVTGRAGSGWSGTWPAARDELCAAVDQTTNLDPGTLPLAAAAVITAARGYAAGGNFATLAEAIDAAYGPLAIDPTWHRRAVRIQSWGVIEFVPPGQEPSRHSIGTVHSHPRIKGGEPYVSGPLAEFDIAARRARSQSGRPIELVGDPLEDDELRFEVLQVIVSAPGRWGFPAGADWRRVPITAAARQARNIAASPSENDDQAFVDRISILRDDPD